MRWKRSFAVVLLAAMATLPAKAQQVTAVTTMAWAEGPTVDVAGNVYFSDVRSNRIMRYAPNGTLSVYRQPANNPNGMVILPGDRLVVCESGDPEAGLLPRITETDLSTGASKVLVDGYEGQRLKAPNDITYDGKGRIYFTSDERPFFLAPFPAGAGTPPEVGTVGVYRIDPDAKTTRILEFPVIHRPNGITVSPDDRTLYTIENDIADDGIRQLLAFDLATDGTAANKRVLKDFRPGRSGDSIAIDIEGNIYVAAGLNALRGTKETLDNKAGIYVFTPKGDLKKFVPVPEDPVTNLTFAGKDMRTVFVTAGKTLFRFENDIPGLPR